MEISLAFLKRLYDMRDSGEIPCLEFYPQRFTGTPIPHVNQRILRRAHVGWARLIPWLGPGRRALGSSKRAEGESGSREQGGPGTRDSFMIQLQSDPIRRLFSCSKGGLFIWKKPVYCLVCCVFLIAETFYPLSSVPLGPWNKTAPFQSLSSLWQAWVVSCFTQKRVLFVSRWGAGQLGGGWVPSARACPGVRAWEGRPASPSGQAGQPPPRGLSGKASRCSHTESRALAWDGATGVPTWFQTPVLAPKPFALSSCQK